MLSMLSSTVVTLSDYDRVKDYHLSGVTCLLLCLFVINNEKMTVTPVFKGVHLIQAHPWAASLKSLYDLKKCDHIVIWLFILLFNVERRAHAALWNHRK